MNNATDTSTEPSPQIRWTNRIRLWIVRFLQLVMVIEFAGVLWQGQVLTALLIGLIFLATFAPRIFKKWLPVSIPIEFQLLAILFVFSALFLGEVRDYYERLWWWDTALHFSSGLLLGIFGFLLVYLLNESRNVTLHMRPHFVAFFAFIFAVAVGAVWEIFEFGMDRIFGMNMQKPMFGDPSGLTDTMSDLIVDTAGALIISVFGWRYLARDRQSFIEKWIHKFVRANPRLFSN